MQRNFVLVRDVSIEERVADPCGNFEVLRKWPWLARC